MALLGRTTTKIFNLIICTLDDIFKILFFFPKHGFASSDGPPPPGRPQVIGVEGDRASIEWRPSLADPTVTTINGGISEGRRPKEDENNTVVGYKVRRDTVGRNVEIQ